MEETNNDSDSKREDFQGRLLNDYQVKKIVEQVCRLDDLCAEKNINIEYCISNQEVKDIVHSMFHFAEEW